MRQENILDLCNKMEEKCTTKYFPFDDFLHCANFMYRLPKTSAVCPYFQGTISHILFLPCFPKIFGGVWFFLCVLTSCQTGILIGSEKQMSSGEFPVL